MSEKGSEESKSSKMSKKETGVEGIGKASYQDAAEQIDPMEVVRARIDGSSLSDEKKIAARFSPGNPKETTTTIQETTTNHKKEMKEGAEPAGAAAMDSFDILDVFRAYAAAPGATPLQQLQWWKHNEPEERNGQGTTENESEAPPSPSLGTDEQPGAYPQAPGDPSDIRPGTEVRQSQQEDLLLAHSASGLSEAMAISEELVYTSEMEAQPFDLEAQQRKRHEWKKQKKLFLAGSAFLVCLPVIAIILVFLFRGKQQGESNPDGASGSDTFLQTMSSSLPPTPFSVSSFILDLLPGETQWTIISRREESPQAKAYKWILQDPNVADYEDWRIVQRFALAVLFLATNGHSWTRSTNWLSYDKHECEWYISPTFAMKEVLGAVYPGYMHGFDPPKQNCYQYDDHNNSTTTNSSDSTMYGKYQNLWLDQNSMDGTLPKELFLLTNLQTLSIMYNKLEVAGGIPSQIGRLTHLEGLVFHALQNVGSMPTEIGLLTNLRMLMLNQFSGTVPAQFQSLTNLETLIYFRNPQLSGPITPMLTQYPKLKWLAVYGSDFTGTIPTEIGQLRSLLFFATNTNRVSGTLPTQVGLLTNLERLILPENSMTGTLPTELGLLKAAKFLGLRDNLFSGTIPSEVGLLSDIANLAFEGNEHVGMIPTELGELTMLFDLTFERNGFSGPIPSEFGSLTTLQRLSLGNNSLTGTIPEELATILNPKLYALDVSGNPLLSGRIPQALCSINGTCTLLTLKNCDARQGLIFDCQNSLLCGCNCPCNSAFGNNNATTSTRQDSHGSLP